MASSSAPGQKTVGYAQELIKVQCDICDTEEDATWHCIECMKNLCTKCKQYHDKFHTDHKIITVFEGRIIRKLTTKCKTHDLVFSYFCNNCQVNVCNKCRKTTHRNCKLIDVDKHAEILKSSFRQKIDKQIKYLPEIDLKLNKINDYLTYFNNTLESELTLMDTEIDKRHKDLDVRKSDLIKKIKSQQISVQTTLHDQIQTLQDLRTSIDVITKSIKTQINLVPDAGVLQLVNEGNAKLDTTSINTNFDLPNPFRFAPSALCDQENNPLGSLQNTDSSTTVTIDTRIDTTDKSKYLSDNESPSPAPSLHRSTPTDPSASLRHEITVFRQLSVGDCVYSCTSDGSTCWVGCYPYTVKLYNQRSDQLLSVRVSHDTRYTALTTTGELLVSGYTTTVISRVNKTGQIRKFTDISARGVECVKGLVITRQDNVFVCVEMKGKTKDKVLTFSARGKKISKLNSHFFKSTKLYGIHDVSRDIFCVLDGIGWEGGRLVFVDGGGQLVRQIDRTTTELQSDITALAGDRHGHLIIATGDSGYIHVLCWEGTCKRTYHIQGLREVWGLSVGEDDVLWIGTGWTGKLIVAKYLE